MATTLARSKSILVIDDDPEIGEVLEVAAAVGGHRVKVAYDQQSALDLIMLETPGLVLLDYYGVGPSPRKFIATLKKLMPRVPVVLMTGARYPEHKARELGLRSVLAKPFDLSDFEDVLYRHGFAKRKERSGKVRFNLFG